MDFQKQLSRHKDFVMISLSMDDYEEPLRKRLAEYKPVWPQARIGLKSKVSADFGVNDRAPVFILIAPDGKIRLQNERNWETIASAVEEMLGKLPEAIDTSDVPPAQTAESAGPIPGNAPTTEARLPVLGNGTTAAVLDLARGELIEAQGDNLRALAAQTAGDIVYMRSGGSAALVGLRGTTLRRWADGRLSSAKPDAQVESARVYFIQQVPCAFRIVTVDRDAYDLRILSVDENAARIEFWNAAEGDAPG